MAFYQKRSGKEKYFARLKQNEICFSSHFRANERKLFNKMFLCTLHVFSVHSFFNESRSKFQRHKFQLLQFLRTEEDIFNGLNLSFRPPVKRHENVSPEKL